MQIAESFSKLLIEAYTAEIREIDRIRREPGFAHRRLAGNFDEVDCVSEEGATEEEE